MRVKDHHTKLARNAIVKIATLKNGKPVTASKSAPDQAICPICGGMVILRKRKKMGSSELTYFWRHKDGKNIECPQRWKLD
jgi:hypothetical protein